MISIWLHHFGSSHQTKVPRVGHGGHEPVGVLGIRQSELKHTIGLSKLHYLERGNATVGVLGRETVEVFGFFRGPQVTLLNGRGHSVCCTSYTPPLLSRPKQNSSPRGHDFYPRGSTSRHDKWRVRTLANPRPGKEFSRYFIIEPGFRWVHHSLTHSPTRNRRHTWWHRCDVMT